ncbi:MAG TPA: hypothetical protein VGA08_02655 [Candidatus Saccharimonadales bacterium]
MEEDTGTNIQQEDLISDDVASAITSAMKDEPPMSGSVASPTVIKPQRNNLQIQTESSGPASSDSPEPALPPPPAQPPVQPTPAVEPDNPPAGNTDDIDNRGSGNFSELYDIKQEALQQLGPLVKHLDQSPEDRFDTLLMMLRASDDPSLIKPAYDAAQAIKDDKKRAEALLDVVNEVNYLTRAQNQNSTDQN